MREPAARIDAKTYSLRRRLIGAIVAASSVLWLASLVIMTSIAWDETSEVFDDALEESGYLIMVATTDWNARQLPGARPAAGAGEHAEKRNLDIQYQIVAGSRVLQRTDGAPATPFVARFSKQHGFADTSIDGERWRVFVTRSAAGGFEVQVGQEVEDRLDILHEIAEHLALPMLALLVLLAALCWFLIGRIVGPIGHTARAIAQKSPHDLTPVATAGQPAELAPIVAALNGVLQRLDAALQAERRFTADAAHELRTPLAALQMHLQLLQRQHPQLAADLDKLRGDTGRSTRLVDSLLVLARLDPLRREGLAREPVALAPLFAELLRNHSDTGVLRGVTLRSRCDAGVTSVLAHPEMLRIVLRNLVDNALRYCSAGCTVELAAEARAGGVRLSVRDNGPGVAPADRARLAERFFRVLGSGQAGSGLGLSIVGRIGELHGAALAFEEGLDGRGLGVVMDFAGQG